MHIKQSITEMQIQRLEFCSNCNSMQFMSYLLTTIKVRNDIVTLKDNHLDFNSNSLKSTSTVNHVLTERKQCNLKNGRLKWRLRR